VAAPKSSESDPAEVNATLLIGALEHFRTWREARIDRGLQVVNYFLVAVAVLATAYVDAVDGKHYGIAVVIALSGTALTGIALTVGFQQRQLADTAEPALTALQNRIADELGIDSIRTGHALSGKIPPYTASWIAFGLAGLLSIAAALYALIH
jgi:hypothetical protein